MLNYLSFAALSFVVGCRTIKHADIVIVESPPLFLAFSGYLLTKFKKAKFVLNVSDLWPESAVVLGMLRSKLMVKWATLAEEWLYRQASVITGQTEGIVRSIRQRCATPVFLLTNGVTPEFLERAARARTARDPLRTRFKFGGLFIVAYTGVHGLAQGLNTVLRSAELLKEHNTIRFCFFGDGPDKEQLQAVASRKKMCNVEFFSPLPSEEMAELLAAVDVSVVPLRRNELFKGALPSKLFEALGAGVPVIASVEGEAKRLIESSASGLVVEPENPADMAQKILTLFHDPELRARLGENGRNYARVHYNREEIAKRFESLIVSATSSQSLSQSKLQEKLLDRDTA